MSREVKPQSTPRAKTTQGRSSRAAKLQSTPKAKTTKRRNSRKNEFRSHTAPIVYENVRLGVFGFKGRLILGVYVKDKIIGELQCSNRAVYDRTRKVFHEHGLLRADVHTEMLSRGHNQLSYKRACIVIEEWKRGRGYQNRAIMRMEKEGLGSMEKSRLSTIVREYKDGRYAHLID